MMEETMTTTATKVRLGDKELFMILPWDEVFGAGMVETIDDYTHGRPSYAHVFSDGRILRLGVVVGQKADLTIIEENIPVPSFDDHFLENLLGWILKERATP